MESQDVQNQQEKRGFRQKIFIIEKEIDYTDKGFP